MECLVILKGGWEIRCNADEISFGKHSLNVRNLLILNRNIFYVHTPFYERFYE